MGDAMKPAARRTGLVVRDLPAELIVYDLERHQAHCLNQTAASVFRGADGTRSLEDLGTLLGEGFDRAEREAAVRMALDQLASAQLLDPLSPVEPGGGLSRRSALRRAGLGAALLLPAVASVVAPTPAEAAATCTQDCTGQLSGTPCNCPASTTAPPCDSSCDGAGNCSGC
jgi:hypothetical protein